MNGKSAFPMVTVTMLMSAMQLEMSLRAEWKAR
jgi:hypothetical protein